MRRIFECIVLLFITSGIYGQLTPVSDQYALNPMTINPAFAGNRGALNIAAFYHNQWAGVTGAPATLTLAADAPFLDSKVGLGVTIARDKIGVSKETIFGTNYSYKLNLKKGSLSFGLGAGILTTNTKWSDLVTVDPGDENYLVDSKAFVIPDFNFGLYYSYQNYFASFSIPRLISYRFNFDKNKYNLKSDPSLYQYMLYTGRIFEIAPKAKVFPSTLISYSPGDKLLYDINANFSYMDKFWVGTSYRNNRSLATFFQFHINNQFKVAYTYSFDFGQLSKYSNGSHEIMFRYEFSYKVDVVNPLIF